MAVKETIQKYSQNHLLLSWCAPRNGYVQVGVPGHASSLCAAMCFASPALVTELLKSGADPKQVDVMGNDALILGSGFGRAENVDVWFESVPNWNVNRCNSLFGATAAHVCCNMGSKMLKTLKRLVFHGANIQAVNWAGSSLLHDVVSSHDSDPDVVKFLLKHNLDTNARACARSGKWKVIFFATRCMNNLFKLSHGSLIRRLALEEGRTPLQDAVLRGDMEIVEILLEHGTEPSIKNNLGRDVLS